MEQYARGDGFLGSDVVTVKLATKHVMTEQSPDFASSERKLNSLTVK
jgi:hypothetical protein